ncbi:glycosyltransferase family 2 protein [Thermosulfurimonas dismutans]|nr:glycosyltransferase family 2 protein [Thermosulfurimonas dismutans]
MSPKKSYHRISYARYLRICADENYSDWLAIYERLLHEQLPKWKNRVHRLKYKPLISVIIYVDNGQKNPDRTIESLKRQVYDRWEYFLVNDENLDQVLAKTSGEYLCFLFAGDVLSEIALACIVSFLNKNGDFDVIYTDSDSIDEEKRCSPRLKPDFSPEYYLSHDYIQNLVVFKIDDLEAIGGFERGYGHYTIYRAFLKLWKHKGKLKVGHIPIVLYSKGWEYEEEEWERGLLALKEFLSWYAPDAKVEKGQIPHTFRVRYPLPLEEPPVSIVIPTRDRVDLLSRCVSSILEKTDYQAYEILIVDNGSRKRGTLEFFKSISRKEKVRVLKYDIPFNFSKLINFGVKHSRGEIVCLLNNDTEVISPIWLKEMVSRAIRKEIGVVGARLLYSDHRVQHAGVVVGLWRGADHAFKRLPADDPGYMYRAILPGNYLAVTAACMVFRKEIFWEVGGFDEKNLAISFNDLDFCLKVYEKGYRIVYTPYAELYHYESRSRGYNSNRNRQAQKELAYIRKKWKKYIERDPYYNPNLTIYREDFRLGKKIRLHCEV